jgi:hypothetical protein
MMGEFMKKPARYRNVLSESLLATYMLIDLKNNTKAMAGFVVMIR